jgi:hypothetical protein
MKVEGLQKEKARLQIDLDEAKLNLQEVSGELHRGQFSFILILAFQTPTRSFICA